MFPYGSNASRMKPKAYHYQDLFFATVIWEKNRYFENEWVHIKNFVRWGSHKHQKQSGSAQYINSNVYLSIINFCIARKNSELHVLL